MRFNPPPGWPPPPLGWSPPPGWRPDPSWPPMPKGWLLWLPDEPPGAQVHSRPAAQAGGFGSRVDDVLRRAVRLAQERAAQHPSDELPPVAPQPVDTGRWASLAEASATFALARSGVPGAEEALGLVRALYNVEDEQTRMLRAVEHDVHLLRQGAFVGGRLLLHEAERLGPGDPEYQRMLDNAKDKFYEAWSLAASIQERALVELNLGLVWQILGRPDDARHWLRESYQSARVALTELAKRSADVKVLHSRWTTAAATYAYPVGMLVLPAKLKKVWDAERARDAIAAFLPFVNCAAAALSALGQTAVPAMELAGSHGSGFVLREAHG